MSEHIVILNQTYAVSMVNGLADNAGCDGQCDCNLKSIEIEAGLTDDQMKRVLMHEILHAYAYESGMSEYLNEQAEEMFCQSLSGMICGMIEWKFR